MRRGDGGRRRRRQIEADQGGDAIPNVRITLNLSVRLGENPVIPGICRAIEGAGSVVNTEVANNARARGIGGANDVAVKKSMGLIEIGGLENVGGDNRAVDAEFGDAIHLNGKKHRDAAPLESAGQNQGLRGTPAMPVDNNSGLLFLIRREGSTVVRIQQPQNFPEGCRTVIALKGFDVHAGWVLLAQARSELNFGVDRIIVADESADEPDDDGRSRRGDGDGRLRDDELASGESGGKEQGKKCNDRKRA